MKLAQAIKRGFTLIELLVVIGILAILLAITLIAINPARQFSQANDTKRRSDINAILNAVGQYAADHNGSLPSGIPNTAVSAATAVDVGSAGADLCSDIVPTYIQALPTDPKGTAAGAPIVLVGSPLACPAAYSTDYQIYVTGGRVTVRAPLTEIAATPIEVTR